MAASELHNLAYVELHDGQPARARELFARARAEAERLAYDGIRPYLVAGAATLAAEDGDAERAARLAGAADAAFAAVGQVPDPDDAAERDRLGAKLVAALGDEQFRSALAEGRLLSVEQALGLTA